jgi:hypothetical protein
MFCIQLSVSCRGFGRDALKANGKVSLILLAVYMIFGVVKQLFEVIS